MRIDPEGKTPYFVMTRIQGRDLQGIVASLKRGEAGEYTRPRLLRIFQDVCLAVAYAHDRGVIHRDLKPANVMVGNWGEVYVVDWGLATVRTAGSPKPPEELPDEAANATATLPPETGREENRTVSVADESLGDYRSVTVDGEILGTPSYMPPEQALGRTEEIDERSDVYSLGAILYEILSHRPPFDGGTALHIVTRVTSEPLTPPSVRVDEARSSAQAGEDAPEKIPPELEEIVLKSMARDKGDRYGSARELDEEIQKYLDGEKERERKRAEAVERVRAGARHLSRFRSLAKEIEDQKKKASVTYNEVKSWEPVERKRILWREQDRVAELRDERIEKFGRAEVAFDQAILAHPENTDGMDGKAALYYERYLAAEKRRDRDEMALNRNLLKEYDKRKKWLKRIDRPGTVSLRAFTHDCTCMRPAAGGELQVEFGHDPEVVWRDGVARPGERLGEKDRPIPDIRVDPKGSPSFPVFGHGPECGRRELTEVEVTIHRFVEEDRHLVLGKETVLGRAPLEGHTLEQGSYLCRLQAEGFVETRLPIHIERGGTWKQEVNLYGPADVPKGYHLVPGGPYLEGGDERSDWVQDERHADDFFMSRRPVTIDEYLEFLCDLARLDPEQAELRQPREGDQKFLIRHGDGWRVPREKEANPLGLDGDVPVFGISWGDCLAYCSWLSGRKGLLYTIPHEEEWEKAARGVDGRRLPYGNYVDYAFSNALYSFEKGGRPVRPGTFPVDESPYGILDLGGNMPTWCLNAPELKFSRDRLIRGGAWCFTHERCFSSYRVGLEPTTAHRHTGIRLVVRPMRR
jgi:serine/threonine-protein kinase